MDAGVEMVKKHSSPQKLLFSIDFSPKKGGSLSLHRNPLAGHQTVGLGM
jgi:hypothetical protein